MNQYMHRDRLELIFRDQQREFLQTPIEVPRENEFVTHLRRQEEVTVITGVRRCGKSTFLRQIRQTLSTDTQVLFASFDDPRFSTFVAADFETLYELWLSTGIDPSRPMVLFFDEVQLVEGWERWIDYFTKRNNTKVFVTGSNATLLSSEIATLLTGRHSDIHLTPLTLRELSLWQKIPPPDSPESRARSAALLHSYLTFGGFPRAYLDQNHSTLRDYYADILHRDIITRLPRSNPRYLIELGVILASESTRLFNRSTVAKILGLKDQVTVGKYVKAFEDTYLFRDLRAYDPSVRKQLRSLSKFYCVDHAMSAENGFRRGDNSAGTTLEQIVFNQLLRFGNDLFYWSSSKSYEVDFLVIDKREPICAIQVCDSLHDPKTLEREVRALKAAQQELKVERAIIVTRDQSIQCNEPKVTTLTVNQFLLQGNIDCLLSITAQEAS
jgi:predicted AAA+ superfamily ATPase